MNLCFPAHPIPTVPGTLRNCPWYGLLLSLCFTALLTAAEHPEPLSPEETAASVRVPVGFQISVFAAEPDVKQPVGLCIDDRGRLWVAEAYSYPNHTDEPANDRILIFEDTDGDGKFDSRKIFYDKLNYVSGIEIGFGGVWVMTPPYFYFIPDKNGDDIPDSEPELLLDGFGNHANSHNIANGFAWGPDGWLYATHGRTNWSMIGKPGTPEAERTRFDGGVWRYHPESKQWEPYADGCTNPWGIDWDDYGQAFIPNTVDPHLFHAIQGAHYEPWRNRESSRFAYKRIETIADHLHYLGHNDVRKGLGSDEEMALGGGHSHCGIVVYLGDNFPERYRNTVFLHNTHGKRINNDVLKRKGSGYTATHAPDLMIAKDPWLMGVNFQTAPDGTVYFTDWSDTGECHSTRNTRKQTGRIYRISYMKPKWQPVDLAKLSDSELVALQLHKNDWHVRHTRRLLHERSAAGSDMTNAHNELHTMFENNPDITRKLRALWALWVTKGADTAFLQSLLDHESEYIRAWAIKLLCEDKNPSPEALENFAELASNGGSQMVRLHITSALQRLKPEQRWPLVDALIQRKEDVDDQNLPLMTWYGMEPLVHTDIARFAGFAERAESGLIRRHIARRIASLGEPQDGLNALFSILGKKHDEEIIDGMLTGLKGRDGLPMPKNWPATAGKLVTGENLEAELRVHELGAIFRDPKSIERLMEIADDESAETELRRKAVGQLIQSKPDGLDKWLLERIDTAGIRGVTLRGLANFSNPEIGSLILRKYPDYKEPATRGDALQTLASRPEWALQLLNAVDKGDIPRTDLTTYTIRQISNLGDKELSKKVTGMWGTFTATAGAKRKQIKNLMRDLEGELEEADLAAGKQVYQTLCAACHKLYGEGGNIGPDLTGAQRSSMEYLAENIIDPGASVSKDFQMQIITLKDDRIITGFISAETETTLTIRTMNDELVMAKDKIKTQITSPVSIMPEGLLNALNDTQIRDLFGYLMK